MFSIELDCPVSINKAYSVNPKTGRRYLTAEAKKWKRDAAFEIMAARSRMTHQKWPYDGKVKITTIFMFKDNRKRDHRNYYKLLDDAFVDGGIIKDDRQITRDAGGSSVVPGLKNHTVIVYLDILR